MSNYTENFPNLSTYDFDTIMCQLRQVCGADPSGMINAQFLSRPTTAKDIALLLHITYELFQSQVELQKQFVELYTFVKDFFENLDLQNEVNNWMNSNIDTIINLLNLKLNNVINVKLYGAKGDGINDDTQSIIDAFNSANEKNMNLYFPYGKYLITNDLPRLNYGIYLFGDVSAIGLGEEKSTILDSRTSTEFLISYSGKKKNGGGVKNIYFDCKNENNINCFELLSNGYLALLENCTFANYAQALNIESDDMRIVNCQFVGCGNREENIYSVLLNNGANQIFFSGCHFETCYLFVNLKNCYMCSFEQCKFEQTYTHLSGEKPPILIDTNVTIGGIFFTDCFFICPDIKVINELERLSYTNIPYFIVQNQYNADVKFTSCKFHAGNGTGTTLQNHQNQSKFLQAWGATIINCTFTLCSYLTPSLYVTNCHLSHNRYKITIEEGDDVSNRYVIYNNENVSMISGYDEFMEITGTGVFVPLYLNTIKPYGIDATKVKYGRLYNDDIIKTLVFKITNTSYSTLSGVISFNIVELGTQNMACKFSIGFNLTAKTLTLNKDYILLSSGRYIKFYIKDNAIYCQLYNASSNVSINVDFNFIPVSCYIDTEITKEITDYDTTLNVE